MVRVQTDSTAAYVAKAGTERGWHYIIGFAPDEPEDISTLERLLNPPPPLQSEKMGRNEACPCAGGKKYKKCCGANSVWPA